MKKYLSLIIAALLCITLVSCSTEKPIEQEEAEISVPILGVEVRNENEASFYALTKSGSYSWMNSEGEYIEADGVFCLDAESICTFTREQTSGGIKLKFSGDVAGYKIYSAEKSEFDETEKSYIVNEKYLVNENNPDIIFPEAGEYYYVVDVKYAQGEITYGFILE